MGRLVMRFILVLVSVVASERAFAEHTGAAGSAARAVAPVAQVSPVCSGSVSGSRRYRYFGRYDEDGTTRFEIRRPALNKYEITIIRPTSGGGAPEKTKYHFHVTSSVRPGNLELEEDTSLPIFQPVTATLKQDEYGALADGEMVLLGRVGRNGPPGRRIDYKLKCE